MAFQHKKCIIDNYEKAIIVSLKYSHDMNDENYELRQEKFT